MISCPNCGGSVKFDIPSQQMKCEFCNALFDPYSFGKENNAEEQTVTQDDYEATVFTCPQCGGEILSTDDSAAGFCSFCGASVVLKSRLEKLKKPNYIIPFRMTKEDCKAAYAQRMKKAIFAPKEMRDPKYIDSFRGIYMPYWAFFVTQNGQIQIPAEFSYRRGNYVYTNHNVLTGDLDAYYKGLSYDASSSFADNISETLAPYDLKGMQEFTPAYLSGFYADTADVASSVYQLDAEEFSDSQTIDELRKVPQFAGNVIEKKNANLFTRTAATDSTMFPVWFLSYRRGDRVAYATVNGQTGKVVTDVPVDPKKYLLGSLILAIPIFLILALCLTVFPMRMMLIASIFAFIVSIICTVTLGKIAIRETDADDRGKQYAEGKIEFGESGQTQGNRPPKNKKEKGKKKKNGAATAIYTVLFILFIILALFSNIIVEIVPASFWRLALWAVIAVAMLITLIMSCRRAKKVDGNPGIAGVVLSFVAVILGLAVTALNLVSDLWYYGVAILIMAAVLVSFGDVMHQYNLLSTRRLPQFEHQGGDDRA